MQAIQRYNYNRLQAYLGKLQKDSEILRLPCEHLDSIILQEKKLKQVYDNYQEALQQIAIIIKQYEKEYKNVQKLKSYHRLYQKQIQKNIFCKRKHLDFSI